MPNLTLILWCNVTHPASIIYVNAESCHVRNYMLFFFKGLQVIRYIALNWKNKIFLVMYNFHSKAGAWWIY